MRKKKIIFWSLIVTILLIVTGSFALQNNRVNAVSRHARVSRISKKNTRKAKRNRKRPLIVVFSNKTAYDQNNLAVGHTMVIARDIQRRTHAKLYEIKSVKAYPNNYQELVRIASKERSENARPAIAGKLPKLSRYSTIFIGSPI